jgi:hypothetical protein
MSVEWVIFDPETDMFYYANMHVGFYDTINCISEHMEMQFNNTPNMFFQEWSDVCHWYYKIYGYELEHEQANKDQVERCMVIAYDHETGKIMANKAISLIRLVESSDDYSTSK